MDAQESSTHCTHVVLDNEADADFGTTRPLGIGLVVSIADELALRPGLGIFVFNGHDDVKL